MRGPFPYTDPMFLTPKARAHYQSRDGHVELEFDRTDPENYEYPRAKWALDRLEGRYVLDVGTAGGQITRAMMTWGGTDRIVDACEPNAGWAVNLRTFLNGSVYEFFVEDLLKWHPGGWETVTLLDVLEHLQEPGEVLKKIASNWKPRRIIATVPLGPWESTEHIWQWDTREEIDALVGPLGGRAEEVWDWDRARWWGIVI